VIIFIRGYDIKAIKNKELRKRKFISLDMSLSFSKLFFLYIARFIKLLLIYFLIKVFIVSVDHPELSPWDWVAKFSK
jgi:hypothetical protein